MPEIDHETLESLSGKLEGLNLTETESALLDQVFNRASAFEAEVSGFSFQFNYLGDFSGANLSQPAFRLGQSLGFVRTSLGFNDPNDPTKPPPP